MDLLLFQRFTIPLYRVITQEGKIGAMKSKQYNRYFQVIVIKKTSQGFYFRIVHWQ